MATKAEIRFAQHLCNKYGWPVGAEDGVYGPATRAGLAAFGRAWNGGRKGLNNDGWYADLIDPTGDFTSDTYRCLTSLARPEMRGAPYLSPHFTVWECASKGNGTCFVRRELLAVLENIRKLKGPFAPVSVYRDPHHNAAVGGASNSQHMYGTAADISGSLGLTIREAEACGAHGIGYYRWSRKVRHVDVRGSRARWTY